MSGTMKTYEGMFLLDAGSADFDAASEPVRSMLAKHSAEAISIKPWEERRLCYEIKGRKRAMYIFTYFKADPNAITEIEHDCQLSESIIRVLILRKDKLTEEEIQADTPATAMLRRSAEIKSKEAEAEAAAAKARAEDAEAATDTEATAVAETTEDAEVTTDAEATVVTETTEVAEVTTDAEATTEVAEAQETQDETGDEEKTQG